MFHKINSLLIYYFLIHKLSKILYSLHNKNFVTCWSKHFNRNEKKIIKWTRYSFVVEMEEPCREKLTWYLASTILARKIRIMIYSCMVWIFCEIFSTTDADQCFNDDPTLLDRDSHWLFLLLPLRFS